MNSMFSLKDKTVMITGASRGIGRRLAVAMAEAGAFVICSSSTPGGTDETIEQISRIGGKSIGLFANLSRRDELENMCSLAFDTYGHVDVLINNGGTIARYPAIDYPLSEWDKVLEVNLTAVFRLSQLVAKGMMDNGGGKIVNIASMLSFSGGITVPAYTASKHGVAGITRALANEWAQYNIQVNAIAPGYIRTDNTQKLQDDPERNAEITKRIPAGRWGEPGDLVGAAIFLSTAASDYVNGTILTVDGGWMAR